MSFFCFGTKQLLCWQLDSVEAVQFDIQYRYRIRNRRIVAVTLVSWDLEISSVCYETQPSTSHVYTVLLDFYCGYFWNIKQYLFMLISIFAILISVKLFMVISGYTILIIRNFTRDYYNCKCYWIRVDTTCYISEIIKNEVFFKW